MSIRFENLQIKNFKTFENVFIKFSGADFIVFDGPNGFGKTSVYDAIELLINGKINRYERLYTETVDGRNTYLEHPYLCETSSTGDLEIISKLLVLGKSLILKRIIEREFLENNFAIPMIESKLYINECKDNIGFKEITDERVFFKKLLGENYVSNFEFINYIEQEENLSFLKQKDSDRKSKIGYLFNTLEHSERAEKLKIVCSKLARLKNKQVSDGLKVQKDEVDKIEKSLEQELEDINYFKLIKSQDFFWDQEVIIFENHDYAEIIGDKSDLKKIKKLVIDKENYKKFVRNNEVQSILSKEKELYDFLKFALHIEFYDKYKNIASTKKKVDEFLKITEKESTDFIKETALKLDDSLVKIINNKPFMDEYHNDLRVMQDRLKSNEKLGSSIEELKSAREKLIKKSKDVNQYPESSSICLFCGHDWKVAKELFENIKNQSIQIEEFIENNATFIEKDLIAFKKNYIDKIKEIFEEYLKGLKFKDDLWMDFDKFYNSKGENRIKKLLEQVNRLKIKYKDLLFVEFELDQDETNLEQFLKRIRSSKVDVGEFINDQSNDEVFERIFGEDFNLLDTISMKDINAKINYVNCKYNIFSNSLLKKKKEKYSIEKNLFDEATLYQKQVSRIKKIHDDAIKKYQEDIIKDIEILFHIYSGRIVQDRKGGNGLFITTTNGIKFVDHPSKSFDALFKLSSGQLAALIISFTLALNKKYSLDKLLLIDDPVQTLDELNIAAFIEVLRNDFSDRQIFISTHEDFMSAYMRYKFEKYGLKTERISMSDIQFEAIVTD